MLGDDRPDAFALPGGLRGAGRIVVTAGMLRALDGQEREALLGHERAHPTARHYPSQAAAQLAG
ncbi:M48 family metalloprotease [Streptomyces siamensis]|uniref:M48 family metalloprotease n=1 Tax=Streptomyces siamensis TaxID=1274986 RepID=UPI003CD07484